MAAFVLSTGGIGVVRVGWGGVFGRGAPGKAIPMLAPGGGIGGLDGEGLPGWFVGSLLSSRLPSAAASRLDGPATRT